MYVLGATGPTGATGQRGIPGIIGVPGDTGVTGVQRQRIKRRVARDTPRCPGDIDHASNSSPSTTLPRKVY